MAVGSYNVYSSYDGKLSGKYLLYVDASALDRPIKPSDYNCSAHKFPLEVSATFGESVRQTFSNLVGEIEVVSAPVDRSELAKRAARGMIMVRGESVDARLRVVPGFWTNGIETDVDIVASITVDGRSGRLLGSTVSGGGHAQGDAGMMCGGGGAPWRSPLARPSSRRLLGWARRSSILIALEGNSRRRSWSHDEQASFTVQSPTLVLWPGKQVDIAVARKALIELVEALAYQQTWADHEAEKVAVAQTCDQGIAEERAPANPPVAAARQSARGRSGGR